MNRISEKHKGYFLIVMVCIAGLIGYFRFSGAPKTTGKQHPVSQTPELQTAALSATQVRKQNDGRRTTPQSRDHRPILRNIFQPTGLLPAIAAPVTKLTHAAPVDMSLSGTIVDGNLAMAIINNQFMLPGQKLGNYQITRITPDSVYLSAGKEQLCLRVIAATEAITE